MSAKQKALIITDGTKSITAIAKTISAELIDYSTKITAADKFEGTDLLASEVFFIGCENSNPDSFSYLQEMLSHINLASRKCGLFSVKQNTLRYLKGITKDSESDTEPFFAEGGETKKAAVKKWLKGLLK